jgi:tRNA (guanine10-N2)-methyltransferase
MRTSPNHIDERPFWIVELPNDEEAKKLASRSVLLRSVLKLWSHSNTLAIFQSQLKDYCKDNVQVIGYAFEPTTSFKITVETFNRKISLAEKVQKIESLNFLPVQGPVNLKTPDVEWMYIEFYGVDPNDVPELPYDYIFGQWICNGTRDTISELSLKKRKFIGNTSMDAQLSLLMANQGLVRPGDFVYDPFVGTGSLLVSAAKFGAFVLGSDIDYMTLHAKSKPTRVNEKVRAADESIYANLRQYGCENNYVDVLISDFSRSIWKDNILFDSIITDREYIFKNTQIHISPTKLDVVLSVLSFTIIIYLIIYFNTGFSPSFYSSVRHSRGYRKDRVQNEEKDDCSQSRCCPLSIYFALPSFQPVQGSNDLFVKAPENGWPLGYLVSH